jgi:hypothetical protein
MKAAILNAFSFESTSWYEPSNSVTFTSTTGKPASTPAGSVSSMPFSHRGNVLARHHAALDGVDELEALAGLGSGSILSQTWPYCRGRPTA